MKIKIIVLSVFLLLLCGCEDWNDIYSEYKDILDDGISCSYTLIGDAEPGNKIRQIAFEGSNEGIYVSYNGGSKNLLINSNNEYETYHVINDFYTYYNNFDYKSFLNQYAQTNTCPSNVYLYVTGDYYIDEMCPTEQICYTYSTKSSSGNNQGSDETDTPDAGKCHIESAIDCNTYSKELYGKDVYFELGFEKLADGSVGRYFIVTDQSSMYGGSVARDSNGLTTTWGQDTYMIMNPDKIYHSSNGNYSIANIKINMTNAGFSNVYYISAYNDDETIGDYEQGDASEYNPDTGNEPSNEMEDLEIKEINFCEENGVRKTFQIVGYLLYIAKIIVPLLLIILGTIDFAKATISSDDKAPKDAVVTLIKRILIAIIIFLIPTILNFLLSLVNGASEAFTDSKFTDCTDCLLDPFGDCKAEDIDFQQ